MNIEKLISIRKVPPDWVDGDGRDIEAVFKTPLSRNSSASTVERLNKEELLDFHAAIVEFLAVSK